jgi:amino acid transporter
VLWALRGGFSRMESTRGAMMEGTTGTRGRKPPSESSKMGLWAATSIAVGTMIGASIFSIFGLGAQIAGRNLPLVFVLSGVLAFLVAHSYAQLGSRIVSNAGAIEFILKGFGDGTIAGTLSFLTWFTYAISIALFAKGFAGYFLPLIGVGTTFYTAGLVAAAVILAFTVLGLLGTKAVGRAELAIVLVKLSILGVFIVLGLRMIRPTWVTPTFAPGHAQGTFTAVAVFFLSYMGFGLVANASENIRDPKRNVPRAIYLSIAIVTLVYVAVALVAVGNVPLAELIKTKDFALAVAAKPFLGQAGYLLIGIGALFSISSALNATLFGGANIAYALAKDGELPRFFERKEWFGGSLGLYLTAAISLVLSLTFNLNGIASMTSAVFMAIYFFVLLSHLRLVKKVGGSRIVILGSIALVVAVFVLLLVHEWRTERTSFYGTWIIFLAGLTIELIYRARSHRRLRHRTASAGSDAAQDGP